jgi:iron complex transport system substrate-binding protein
MSTPPARASRILTRKPIQAGGIVRRAVLFGVLSGVLSGVLGACGGQAEQPPPEIAAAASIRAAAPEDHGHETAGYPRSLLGHDGVQVRLAAPPRRVVPASAGLVDLACSLLPPERLAGLPGQALAYSSLRDEASPYLQRPRFEVYAAEPVLGLRPDLVLADAWQSRETTESLRGAGVPVLVLGQLERSAQAESALRLLAEAFGTEDACDVVLAQLRARTDALAATGATRRGWRALSYVNGGTGGWVAGAGTTPDEWITMTGMTNAAAAWQGHARCSFEQLLELDPDLIVVSGRAAYDDMSGTAGLLRSEPALASLAALRGERVIVLDAWLYNTLGLHSVAAAEALARAADRAMATDAAGGDGR